MGGISQDLIAVLQYLLPGFLCAWVYYGLTSYSKPSEFERVVQALIFTLLVHAFDYPIKALLFWSGTSWAIAPWSESSDLILSVACAFALGVLISFFANTDHVHRVLRALGITRETSYPSEWFGTFSNNVTYVVLHLKNNIRIYGWPIEWPSDPSSGHFLLMQVSWLDEDNNQTELKYVTHVLVPVSDVTLVEFMNLNWSPHEERIEPSSSCANAR